MVSPPQDDHAYITPDASKSYDQGEENGFEEKVAAVMEVATPSANQQVAAKFEDNVLTGDIAVTEK